MAMHAASKRTKISVTVNTRLLEGVDAFVSLHPGADRSKVMDEALMLWYAQKQQRDIEAQFGDPEYPQDEMDAWRAVRRQAAIKTFRRWE